jgi:hypothetical protein
MDDCRFWLVTEENESIWPIHFWFSVTSDGEMLVLVMLVLNDKANFDDEDWLRLFVGEFVVVVNGWVATSER